MKKLLLWLLAALVLFAAGTYLLIPSVIRITSSVVVNATDFGTERIVIDDSKWPQWWNYGKNAAAGNATVQPERFRAGEYDFQQTGRFYKATEISISNGEHVLPSKLVMIALGVDTTGIEWRCDMTTGNDPISRLLRYSEARRIKKTMDEVLSRLNGFLSKTENVYGIAIERSQLKDTLYASCKLQQATYPALKEVYALIGKINAYLTRNGSHATGNPIYNVTEIEQGRFQLMAAVPTDRMLKETEGIRMKNMVKGSFMITEVVGGEREVNRAWHSLQQYFQDYRKTSMAMNFTMLVTDRSLQTDSSKWVTKLYMPVY